MGIHDFLKSGTFFRSKRSMSISDHTSADANQANIASKPSTAPEQPTASRCPITHLLRTEDEVSQPPHDLDNPTTKTSNAEDSTSEQHHDHQGDSNYRPDLTVNTNNTTTTDSNHGRGYYSGAEMLRQVGRAKVANRKNSRPTTTSSALNTTYYLLQEIGGKEKMVQMVTRFYEHAFEDKLLDTFIMHHSDPHGERLGLWMAEKMGDIGVWSDHRSPNARQMSHHRSWYSHKRTPEDRGTSFQLKDCVVWMRLMFWSARQEGLMDNAQYQEWFIDFISRWIRVYEYTAPPHTRACADWSLDAGNIRLYEENGHCMPDLEQFENKW